MLATHCRSPDTFISWILSSVLHLLLPLTSVTSSTRSSLVVGVLTVIRNIVPHLSCDDCDQETLETLVQVYQVCVTLTSDKKDQNIVTTALETLVQVLRSPPPVLLYLLTSDAGLDPGQGSSMEESVVSVTRLSNHHHDTSDNEADSEGDTDREEIVINKNNSHQSNNVVRDSKETALVSLAKHLTRFLLSDMKNELVDERSVRVSVKTLSVSVLTQVIKHCPGVWSLALDSHLTMDSLTSVLISDVVLYLNHTDPALRGGVAR